MRAELTDTEYRRFRDWLIEEFGLKFGPEKRDILRSRLEPLRADLGFDSFEQLLFHLKFHPRRQAERERLIPYLTNNESYFFREHAQLDLLRDEALRATAERLEARKRHEIRLLSAGCAAGEEPYSLAMTVREARGVPAAFGYRITGIDVDPAALDRARAAEYGENAFRRTDTKTRDRFFESCSTGSWKVRDPIRETVRFERVNLIDPEWPRRLPRQDIIFCRNVLIYFDEAATRAAVAHFYSALEPGGFLFLGHAESLSRVPTRFVPIRRSGAIYYQKPEVESE